MKNISYNAIKLVQWLDSSSKDRLQWLINH